MPKTSTLGGLLRSLMRRIELKPPKFLGSGQFFLLPTLQEDPAAHDGCRIIAIPKVKTGPFLIDLNVQLSANQCGDSPRNQGGGIGAKLVRWPPQIQVKSKKVKGQQGETRFLLFSFLLFTFYFCLVSPRPEISNSIFGNEMGCTRPLDRRRAVLRPCASRHRH